MKFDSIKGTWPREVSVQDGRIVIEGEEKISYSQHATIAEIPWDKLNVDIVVECSGKFLTQVALEPHFQKGVKKVVVSSPVKEDGVLNIVMVSLDIV